MSTTEVERLRAALNIIALYRPGRDLPELADQAMVERWMDHVAHMRMLAVKALEAERPEGVPEGAMWRTL